MILFKRYFSTIGILGKATDLLPSMRAPPDMSNVIIVLKAGQSSVFRAMYLWLGITKIINTKSQETEPRHNTLDVACSMSIQFPGGF